MYVARLGAAKVERGKVTEREYLRSRRHDEKSEMYVAHLRQTKAEYAKGTRIARLRHRHNEQ